MEEIYKKKEEINKKPFKGKRPTAQILLVQFKIFDFPCNPHI